MNRTKFKSDILALHDNPQRGALAGMALDAVFSGMDELARLGHHVEVMLVQPAEPLEWPKMLYHPNVPEGKVFHQQEHVPVEPGWQDKPLGQDEPEDEPEELSDSDKSRLDELEAKGSDTSEDESRERDELAAKRDKREAFDKTAKLPRNSDDRAGPIVGAGSAELTSEYPKRMYHPMFPGGLEVQNSAVEATHLGQGWGFEPIQPQDQSGDGNAKPTDDIDANPLAHPTNASDMEPVGGNAGIDLAKSQTKTPSKPQKA